MTTQSDNTLEGILKKFAIDTHEVRPGQDETLNFDNAKAALTKWRDDAIAAQNLALLTRLEAQLGVKISLDGIYGSDFRNNYGYNETQVRDAANHLSRRVTSVLQSERALIEKRMM